MAHKKDAPPLRLMPLDEFKKFVQAIARVPKEPRSATPTDGSSHRKGSG